MKNLAFRSRTGVLLMSSAVLVAANAPTIASANVNCNIPQPCAIYQNAQGIGFEGFSVKSTGLYGGSTNQNGVLGNTAAKTGIQAGVFGSDLATNNGLNDGVLGTVTNGGWGVEGRSSNGAFGGVKGSASNGFGVSGSSSSYIGVYGSSSSYFGVSGYSSSGSGVFGSSYTGFGVQGSTSSNDAGHFQSSGAGTGVAAISGTGDALYAVTGGGVGAYIHNSNGNGTDVTGSYIGLLGRSDAYPLVLTNQAGNDLFFVDGAGNVFVHGSYNTFAPTRSGGATTAFTTKTTAPSVEDVGSAQLVNGVAMVAFDPAFAASMDAQAAYHVFLTPGGDTRGLYIASKTASGFVVRETQGGRASLSFDYRIVGSALGHARERMAFVGNSAFAAPKAAPVARQPKQAPVQADPALHMNQKAATH